MACLITVTGECSIQKHHSVFAGRATSGQPVPVHAVGVFPFRAHLTANRLKRGYVEVTVEDTCSLFGGGQSARGFVCHTAEILQERVVGGLPAVGSGRRNSLSSRDAGWQAGYSALMQTAGAKPVQEVWTIVAKLSSWESLARCSSKT